MDEDRKNIKLMTTINVCFVVLFLLLDILSYSIAEIGDLNFLLRVFSRGVFGIMLLTNAVYLLLPPKPTYYTVDMKHQHRIFCGISLGIVGLVMLITAALGYGTNGDPVLKWWQ